MEQYRKLDSFVPPSMSQIVIPCNRKPSNKPYAFTGRRLEIPKGRICNHNEIGVQRSTMDLKSSRYLTNIESPEYRNNFKLNQVAGADELGDLRFASEIKNYLFTDPFFKNSKIYNYTERDFEASQAKFPAQLTENLCLADTKITQKTSVVSEAKRIEISSVNETERKLSEQSVETKNKQTQEGFLSRKRENHSRILTGPVEKIIQWFYLKSHFHLLFEVIGFLVDVKQGMLPTEKRLVLKDEKTGPSLLVIYYEMDRSLPELSIGSIVKCIGRLTSRNCLQAFKVEPSSEQERADSQRLFFISGLVAEQAKAISAKK